MSYYDTLEFSVSIDPRPPHLHPLPQEQAWRFRQPQFDSAVHVQFSHVQENGSAVTKAAVMKEVPKKIAIKSFIVVPF